MKPNIFDLKLLQSFPCQIAKMPCRGAHTQDMADNAQDLAGIVDFTFPLSGLLAMKESERDLF